MDSSTFLTCHLTGGHSNYLLPEREDQLSIKQIQLHFNMIERLLEHNMAMKHRTGEKMF